MHVHVGEELRHRIGAHVLDPGRRHRQMQVDRRDHEGRLARGIAEVEHRERPVAEIAAVVEELGDVFRVLGAAQDDGVDPAPVHHRLQALLVEKDRLARHGVLSRCVACCAGCDRRYSARMPAALMIGAHLAISSRTNLPRSSGEPPPASNALRLERVQHFLGLQQRGELRVQARDDLRRRAGGREERLPGVDDGSGQVLGHRRQVRHEARAARRGDGERAELVLLDHADGGGQRHDGGLDLSADARRRPQARRRDRAREPAARRPAPACAIARWPGAPRPEVPTLIVSGLRTRQRDELREDCSPAPIGCTASTCDSVAIMMIGAKSRTGSKVTAGHQRIGHQRIGRDHDGVAVRTRLRDRVETDVAGAAGTVLHHEGLAETIGRPRPNRRDRMSRLPPGADGAMIRTGCDGHPACAASRRGSAAAATEPPVIRRNVRRRINAPVASAAPREHASTAGQIKPPPMRAARRVVDQLTGLLPLRLRPGSRWRDPAARSPHERSDMRVSTVDPGCRHRDALGARASAAHPGYALITAFRETRHGHDEPLSLTSIEQVTAR